jgi:hypothetical protein
MRVPADATRSRQLYRLTDQGHSQTLLLSDFGIGGRDRSWNAQAQNFIAANRQSLDAIAVEIALSPGPEQIALALRPAGVVGAVPLYAPHTRRIAGGVIVRPRYGWDGIGPLLELTGWATQPQLLDGPLVPGSAREIPPWVLAGPVLMRLAALVRELRRGFRVREQVRQAPRGQVLWPRYVSAHAGRGAFHQVPCRFSDLGPDELLRGYLRWGIEAIRRAVAAVAGVDAIARRLLEQADALLCVLSNSPPRAPNRHGLSALLAAGAMASEVLARGVEALGWIVDERGLAGHAASDGLAWALPMHRLFEHWVGTIVARWAAGFGAEVLFGDSEQTRVPLHWEARGHGSLSSLVPDIVVRDGDRVYVIDAKYKDHFEALDEERWWSLAEDLRAGHRHDVHQVLAYAGLFEAGAITAALVYPLRSQTWRRLAAAGRSVVRASLTSGGRPLNLALVGLPMQVPPGGDLAALAHTLDVLRDS